MSALVLHGGRRSQRTITIVGRERYREVLAVGGIIPEFDPKQVILAGHTHGTSFDADYLRVVVPLDKRGGRSVREAARFEVTAPSPAD